MKESVATSKAETTPKSEPKATTKSKAEPTAETKAKAKADAKAKSSPKPFRVDRNGGDLGIFEQSWKSETHEERKMMEADVQRFLRQRQWQWHTEHDGSWKFAAEEWQKLEEKAVENQTEDEVENHVDEANKVQMVKKCHMRNSSIRQTLSRSGQVKQQELQQTSH